MARADASFGTPSPVAQHRASDAAPGADSLFVGGRLEVVQIRRVVHGHLSVDAAQVERVSSAPCAGSLRAEASRISTGTASRPRPWRSSAAPTESSSPLRLSSGNSTTWRPGSRGMPPRRPDAPSSRVGPGPGRTAAARRSAAAASVDPCAAARDHQVIACVRSGATPSPCVRRTGEVLRARMSRARAAARNSGVASASRWVTLSTRARL